MKFSCSLDAKTIITCMQVIQFVILIKAKGFICVCKWVVVKPFCLSMDELCIALWTVILHVWGLSVQGKKGGLPGSLMCMWGCSKSFCRKRKKSVNYVAVPCACWNIVNLVRTDLVLWDYRMSPSVFFFSAGGICGTVVARWTAGQQVEWSCTRGMIHNKIHLISPGCPLPCILTNAKSSPKTPFIL